MTRKKDAAFRFRLRRRIYMRFGRRSLEVAAWDRGHDWAERNGYGFTDDGVDSPRRDAVISQSGRDCRIIAMAYAAGWLNGRKSVRKGAGR